jgi:hypothetical protein
MNLGRLRARKTREWVCLLLLPALAFRLLVPAGFMPTASDGFSVTMQMCHGDGKSSVIVRLFDDPPASPAGDDERHEAPCVFAASSAAAPPEAPLAALDVALRPATAPLPTAAAPVLRHAHQPQSPRAPPQPV